MNRKSTPDIMGNLMGATMVNKEQQSNNAIKQEILIATEQEVNSNDNKHESEINKTINPVSSKTLKMESHTVSPDGPKEKTTFNLSAKALNILEDAWMKLRRKFKGEQRITKTLIVEKAIEIVLNDLESKNELSDLYLRLKN